MSRTRRRSASDGGFVDANHCSTFAELTIDPMLAMESSS